MVLHLDSRAERLIEEQFGTGRFQTAEEVVARALETLAGQTNPVHPVDAILDLRKRNNLSLGEGYSINDLIRESRNLD